MALTNRDKLIEQFQRMEMENVDTNTTITAQTIDTLPIQFEDRTEDKQQKKQFKITQLKN